MINADRHNNQHKQKVLISSLILRLLRDLETQTFENLWPTEQAEQTDIEKDTFRRCLRILVDLAQVGFALHVSSVLILEFIRKINFMKRF